MCGSVDSNSTWIRIRGALQSVCIPMFLTGRISYGGNGGNGGTPSRVQFLRYLRSLRVSHSFEDVRMHTESSNLGSDDGDDRAVEDADRRAVELRELEVGVVLVEAERHLLQQPDGDGLAQRERLG